MAARFSLSETRRGQAWGRAPGPAAEIAEAQVQTHVAFVSAYSQGRDGPTQLFKSLYIVWLTGFLISEFLSLHRLLKCLVAFAKRIFMSWLNRWSLPLSLCFQFSLTATRYLPAICKWVFYGRNKLQMRPLELGEPVAAYSFVAHLLCVFFCLLSDCTVWVLGCTETMHFQLYARKCTHLQNKQSFIVEKRMFCFTQTKILSTLPQENNCRSVLRSVLSIVFV